MRPTRLKTTRAEITPYITKDGSEIRELMHPDHHGNRNQSLAEATVYPGRSTTLHKHLQTEELYHITGGSGLLRVGDREFPVTVGDTVHIEPGVFHQITNTGAEPLRILCCCAPPYSHDDTQLLE